MLGPYSWVAAIPEDCHLCTEISKWRTIMQATVSQCAQKLEKKIVFGLIVPSSDGLDLIL